MLELDLIFCGKFYTELIFLWFPFWGMLFIFCINYLLIFEVMNFSFIFFMKNCISHSIKFHYLHIINSVLSPRVAFLEGGGGHNREEE